MDPVYLAQLDAEFKSEYKDYIGVDPDSKENRGFTYDEQVERYARNLVFWINKFDEKKSEPSKKAELRETLTHNARQELLRKIAVKFTLDIQKQINARVVELLAKHKRLEEIRIELVNKNKKSEELFELAKQDIVDEDFNINPATWIFNQTKMRTTWEKHKIAFDNLSPVGVIMMNNPFSNYMKFMYDNYPPGFGEALATRLRAGDMSEVYYDLTEPW